MAEGKESKTGQLCRWAGLNLFPLSISKQCTSLNYSNASSDHWQKLVSQDVRFYRRSVLYMVGFLENWFSRRLVLQMVGFFRWFLEDKFSKGLVF